MSVKRTRAQAERALSAGIERTQNAPAAASADDTVRFDIDPTLGNLGHRDGGQLYFLLDVRRSETGLQPRLDSNQGLQRITAFTSNRGDQIRVYRLL